MIRILHSIHFLLVSVVLILGVGAGPAPGSTAPNEKLIDDITQLERSISLSQAVTAATGKLTLESIGMIDKNDLDQKALEQIAFNVSKQLKQIYDSGKLDKEFQFFDVFQGINSVFETITAFSVNYAGVEKAAINGWGLNVDGIPEPEAFESPQTTFRIMGNNAFAAGIMDDNEASPR